MEVKVVMSCNCECRWHDLDVPPAVNAPCYCEAHGDVEIKDVSVTGVADFFVRDAGGDWWHRGRIVTDDELASVLAPLVRGEDYDTFPLFSRSTSPVLVVIYQTEV